MGVIGPKPHVLIVEDNLINQTVLMRQLKHVGLTTEGESGLLRSLEADMEKSGADVSVANNGLEALEKIRKCSKTDGSASGQPFDCVIMDLEMPGEYLSPAYRGFG
jgi:CheY-like chemotaxis protein